MAKKQKQAAFPKQIFVTRETDSDEPYLVSNETIDTVDDGRDVGIYELREVRRKVVTHALD